jgi:acetylornithine/N-succinyldiaminopimelate aminotransferase
VVEAVVDKVTEPGFLDHVNEMGGRLAAGFDRLCTSHPDLLVGHRGLGLMRALDTVSSGACYRFMLEAIDAGVLAIWANNKQETLLVMPPLVIEADDVDAIIDGLSTAAARAGAA